MKRAILLFVALIVPLLVLFAQSDTTSRSKLQSYVQNIQVFNRLIPQEKVYLHFDNTGYVLGETIWFKAYVVMAGKQQLVSPSKVLYVELLNSKGKVLETKKLKIEEKQCSGEFFLKITDMEYYPGFYEIRAYTRNMLNFGDEVVFSRVFPVFKEEKDIYSEEDLGNGLDIQLPDYRNKNKVAKRKKVNVSFYPEGGNLIEGLASRMGIKVVDENGRSLDVSGKLVNPNGEIIKEFSTLHNGMVLLNFIPNKQNYSLSVFYKRKEHIFDLPDALPQGYVMTVDNNLNKDLMINVEKSSGLPSQILGLSVMCRGNVTHFQTIDTSISPYILRIPRNILSSGVNQATLFDDKGEILSERLFFVSLPEEEQIYVKTIPDKELYEPIEKINVSIEASSKTDPAALFLSLAIRDRVKMVETLYSDNLYTNLLLSSDLQGYIENPGYYFSSDNSEVQNALDLLMLIQGWKRYEWQSMAGILPFRKKHDLETDLMIKGKVHTFEGRNAEVKLRMQNKSMDWMEGEVVIDSQGEFIFYPGDFYGKWYLALRCRTTRNAAKNIRLDRWFSPRPKLFMFADTYWRNVEILSLLKNKKDLESIFIRITSFDDSTAQAYLIKEVKVRNKVSKSLIHPVGMLVDRLIDEGRKYPVCVHDYLVEYDNNYCFEIISDDMIIQDPFYYTDDSFPNWYYYLKPSKASILYLKNDRWKSQSYEVIRSGKDPKSVIRRHLTAKRNVLEVEEIVVGGLKEDENDKGISYHPIYLYLYDTFPLRVVPGTRYTSFEGYSKPKAFFAAHEYQHDLLPDSYNRRRTLYWNPDVKMSSSGKTTISFYNNDICKLIDVSIEGISADGKPVRSCFQSSIDNR